QHKVLAHHRQANQSDIAACIRHCQSLPILARAASYACSRHSSCLLVQPQYFIVWSQASSTAKALPPCKSPETLEQSGVFQHCCFDRGGWYAGNRSAVGEANTLQRGARGRQDAVHRHLPFSRTVYRARGLRPYAAEATGRPAALPVDTRREAAAEEHSRSE